jgi:hypothetical protein
MICRVVNADWRTHFGEDARRISFDLVLQIGPAAMVRKLFFVSYSRALQICINLLEGAQLALDHREIRMLRHRLQEDLSIKLCLTFSKSRNILGVSNR